jgi:exodeoxyribonuclease VIII
MSINTELSNEEYHAERDHYSSSALKLYLKDPIEFHKQYILGEKAEYPPALLSAFDFGSYIHTLVLEPHMLDEEYILCDDGERSQYEGQGKIVITKSQNYIAQRMMKNFNETNFHPDGKKIKTFFQRGTAEESFFGELDGMAIKVRTDYRKSTKRASSINDVKTTSKNINLKNVKKICQELDYDLSAALYIDLVEQVTGVEHDFFFLFMGKKDYKSEIFRASPEFIERGREKYKRAISGIKKSLETGVWLAEV